VLELKGKYNTAKVFTNNIEPEAAAQIVELLNQEFVKDSQIRIMPDTHAGKGCTIGTTMTIQDKIVANLVGVDIGCGMEVAIIATPPDKVNFDQLDETIRKHVPSGFSIRSKKHPLANRVNFGDLIAPVSVDRAEKSIGTLGGGNHFIELNEWDDSHVALVIHSGSRNLGKQVAEYYQKRAYDELMSRQQEKQEIIERLKREGREKEIQSTLAALKRPNIPKDLAYVEGKSFDAYMHDMKIAQYYASLNRKAMVQEIVEHMGWTVVDGFTTIHNYIDMEHMILRKGAISAQKGERVIIPMNMRDGSLICIGKGDPDWNYSAPHGAGRLMSRSKAKANLSMEVFKETMKNVWSTSVVPETLDESPMAYKPMEEIMENIQDTAMIERVIKPLYNFKAH
jgi:tRNA-splicing ligase RtcB